MVLSTPLASSAYCSRDCIEEKLWLFTWDGHREFWCACLVVRQLGRRAFRVPAHSGPSFAATNTVFRATGKKNFLWAMNCFYFPGFSPPSQADRFFFPTLPSQPISPTKLSAPPPNVSTAILQANIL